MIFKLFVATICITDLTWQTTSRQMWVLVEIARVFGFFTNPIVRFNGNYANVMQFIRGKVVGFLNLFLLLLNRKK